MLNGHMTKKTRKAVVASRNQTNNGHSVGQDTHRANGRNRRNRAGHTTWQSILTALGGVVHTFRHERNAQIEIGIAALAVILGILLSISTVEWAVLVFLVFVVLALETMNTALEAAVDLVTEDHHELAKIAKDAAAGAVVLMAIGSLVVACFIFGPRLWQLVSWLFA